MQAPDNWNSGIVSQTVAKLNWRLNGLTATNNDLSGFFIVVNLPSLANLALPLGQKTGLLSWIISQYATINNESDVTLTDVRIFIFYLCEYGPTSSSKRSNR